MCGRQPPAGGRRGASGGPRLARGWQTTWERNPGKAGGYVLKDDPDSRVESGVESSSGQSWGPLWRAPHGPVD